MHGCNHSVRPRVHIEFAFSLIPQGVYGKKVLLGGLQRHNLNYVANPAEAPVRAVGRIRKCGNVDEKSNGDSSSPLLGSPRGDAIHHRHHARRDFSRQIPMTQICMSIASTGFNWLQPCGIRPTYGAISVFLTANSNPQCSTTGTSGFRYGSTKRRKFVESPQKTGVIRPIRRNNRFKSATI